MTTLSPHEPLPPDEEAVRHLLAEARHDEPAPPAVVARIDAVLASLADEGVEPPHDAAATDVTDVAGPADLATRRRRHRHAWTAAAAAVVVLGVGGTLVQQGALSPGPSGAGDSAGTAVSSDEVPESAGSSAEDLSGTLPDVARLRPGRLEPQLRRLLATPLPPVGESAAQLAASCGASTGPEDRVVPVTWAGEPAVAVVRPATAAGTLVDVVVCGRASPVRSVLLAP